MSEQKFPVGIDLGTTFSSISYVDDQGRVETVRLEDGAFAMASAIYFESATQTIVGSEALNYAVIEPERVARAFKRHMGEPDWTFTVDDKTFRAEELSALVLKKLIQQAEAQIGKITDVVISVPFIFHEAQRRATKNAGQIAGVNVLDIVDEPVAGALAYGHTLLAGGGFHGGGELDELFSDAPILVYDLGGGTFDLTLMHLETDYTFRVIATAGDDQLGGEDWDKELTNHFAERYGELFGVSAQGNNALLQELRVKAQEAKISLSERPRVEVELRHEDRVETVEIARGAFELMCAHLVDRTRSTLEEMLEKAGKTFSHFDFVLLIGGSSRMPMISKMLESETGRRLDMSLPPDTAVSKGAALYAAHQTGDRSMMGVSVKTVNPHALGLLAFDRKKKQHVNDVLIRANEPTETSVAKTYPVLKGATRVKLTVLQGELRDPDACVRLGEAEIPEMDADLLAEATVQVTFSFQQNGLLSIRGLVEPAGGKPPVEVTFDIQVEGSMTEDDVIASEANLCGIAID